MRERIVNLRALEGSEAERHKDVIGYYPAGLLGGRSSTRHGRVPKAAVPGHCEKSI